MKVDIRSPKDIREYKQIETLQVEIWGSREDVVPAHLLLTIEKEGGVVLLALANGAPFGFAFGFPALTADGRLKLASHQAGVLPAFQGTGWGYRLKLVQRDVALSRGFNLMTWTFDPLQGRNARLNLHKLGAVCNTYLRNLYGDMTDQLNKGLPSDRFRVDWWLESDHVANRLAGESFSPAGWQEFPLISPTQQQTENGLAGIDVRQPVLTSPFCLIEIPENLHQLKLDGPDQALNWRLFTRAAFEQAFSAGFTVVDLFRRKGRNFYLLQKNWTPN
jgi:predicted GNAT superfamily acetyltransferase